MKQKPTIQLRRQFSLRTLMIVSCALGMNFAWLPSPISAVLAALIVLPLFLVGISIGDWVAIFGVPLVLIAFLLPAVSTVHRKNTSARPRYIPPAGVPGGPDTRVK
jgi:hypothetical protein